MTNDGITRLLRWKEISDNIMSSTNVKSHFPPSAQEIVLYEEYIRQHWPGLKNFSSKRMLVLGATCDLIKFGLELGFEVKAYDYCSEMITKRKMILLSNDISKDIVDRVFVEKNWLKMDKEADGQWDVIIGDAALNSIPYEQITPFLLNLKDLLYDDGLLVVKEIVLPINILGFPLDSNFPHERKFFNIVLSMFTDKKISLLRAYSLLRFVWAAQKITEDSIQFCKHDYVILDANDAFTSCLSELGSKYKDLTDYFGRHQNKIIHTICRQDHLAKLIRKTLGQPIAINNPTREVFTVYIFDRAYQVHDYEITDTESSDYIRRQDENMLRIVRSQLIRQGGVNFAHLGSLSWSIGELTDIISGRLDGANLIFSPSITNLATPFKNDDDLWKYLSSLALYELLSDDGESVPITEFMFKHPDMPKGILHAEFKNVSSITLQMFPHLFEIKFPNKLWEKMDKNLNSDYLITILENYKSKLIENTKTSNDDDIHVVFPGQELVSWRLITRDFFHKSMKDTLNEYQDQIDTLKSVFSDLIIQYTPLDLMTYLPLFRTLLQGMFFGINCSYTARNCYLVTNPMLIDQNIELSFAGVIIYTDQPIQNMPEIYSTINEYCSKRSIWKWGKKINEELRIPAIKSSIAAIMARNMSHNIGSHVLVDLNDDSLTNG
jgi:hypothetical protein